jgi:hypothetical protein
VHAVPSATARSLAELGNAPGGGSCCAAARRLRRCHQPHVHGRGAAVPNPGTAMRVQHLPRSQVCGCSFRARVAPAWLIDTPLKRDVANRRLPCAEYAPAKVSDIARAKIAWRRVLSSTHQSWTGLARDPLRVHVRVSTPRRCKWCYNRRLLCDKWLCSIALPCLSPLSDLFKGQSPPDALGRPARHLATIQLANAIMPQACVGVRRACSGQIALVNAK